VSYSSEVLADSPLAYYRLGEASGTTMTDSSGNGRDGTYPDAPTLGVSGLLTGDADTAANFNGTSDYGNIADAAWLEVTTITVEAWIKPDQVSALVDVVSHDGGNETNGRMWILRTTTGGKAEFVVWTAADQSSARVITGTTTLVVGSTYHLAGTYDGTTARLYVNGAQESSLAVSGVLRVDSSRATKVGRNESNADRFFDGVIDELAFYSGALSSTRIADHYTAGTVGPGPELSLAGSIPGLTSVISLDAASPISLAAEVPGLTSALTLDVAATEAELSLSSSLPGMTAAFTLDAASPISLGGSLPGLTAAFTLDAVPISVLTLAASLPGLTGALNLAKPTETDRRNRVGGRQRRGIGVATWEPAVVAPPASVAPVHDHEKARAFTVPTIGTRGRPIYTATEIEAKRHRIRVIVGGKDVSFFRDVATPPPSYRLVEPLDYGAGTLELPQISPAFETLGVGALKWLKKGKRVIVQRVNVDTNAVVATDYRGIITDFSVNGNSLVCELGGEVSGRAALMDKQPPLFRTVKDIGRYVYGDVSQCAPVRFTPRLGPVTGIRVAKRGGASMLDHLNEMVALATTVDGDQYTVGRRANGTWGMWLKDVTTIDATIYLDDARMVADLHNALAEEPDRIFMTGVNPDGQRIKFGAYPGLKQGAPAPYPFDNTSTTFDQGTTNDDCDHPADGPINAMIFHLVTMGFLSEVDAAGGYDANCGRAIRRLQDQVGLSETGTMNLATWKALFDISSTGYSLTASRILPAVQRSSVKPWNLSASGAKISRNPAYDKHKVKVDRSISVGSGFTRRQMRDWARAELREANTPNWVGTITCHLAAIEGEHNPGDPLTDDMLMPISAIKQGMNVWLPTFDGGTLVHVSGKEVPESGPQVLTVDTRARDTMAAWECITRNRESRHNPARAWHRQNRQSGMQKDAYIEWDEISGVLDDSVHLEGDTWNVIPVLAGQGGTVRHIRIALDSDVRFSVSVTARSIRAARMNHLVPAPLTEAGSERWDKQWVRNALDDRGWVYQAGKFEQRCGYWPGVETGDDGDPSGDPINGQWQDDAGFGYHTFAEPVLYVAIWPEADCRLRAGRIMWNQLEAGA
jgi:hypothetical protein